MSWWDTTGISSFATQALKNAQKKIDKVLDIKEDEAGGGTLTITGKLVSGISCSDCWGFIALVKFVFFFLSPARLSYNF